MKEFSSPALELFREHLKYRDDHTIRYLQPYYDVVMLQSEKSPNPPEIIRQAFPRADPATAKILERTTGEFNEGIIDFFTHLELTKESNQLNLAWDLLQFQFAYEFLEKLEPCINIQTAQIWEYLAGSSYDELGISMISGFTYIIVDEHNLCLIVRGGYED